MKVTYTNTQARRILLAFLAFVLLLSVAALVVRWSISKKLDKISKLSVWNDNNTSQPEKILILLQDADNDFQASLVSKDPQKRNDYKTKLSQAFEKIDTLLKEKADTANLSTHQSFRIEYWYDKKLKLSDKLVALRQSFDSLLTNYSGVNLAAGANPQISFSRHNISSQNTKNNSDTTANRTVNKMGLFKRLKAAIVNKQGNATTTTTINHHQNTKETEVITQKLILQNKVAYNEKLRLLQQQNLKILNTQRGLIVLNSHIITELDGIISDIKDINFHMADTFKETALKLYRESAALLNLLYLIALLLVIIFSVLLIVFIIQLNRSEMDLRKEMESSVAIAQQKMDLLHHMSHEIRNPLTVIKGALYMINRKLPLSKQQEMLNSITLSSDMMLTTLNDTLDAAKMESNELRINSDPFNPESVIKQVIDSMTFSAARKGLFLNYNFNGNGETVLEGDSFRLKQILINLVSNAIKYTPKGGVTVTATLPEGDTSLQVDIADTGLGISQEQQENLFSKYYQTNSSKGQLGTGLGLFICKQLVKLQDGKISVRSNADAGVTFTFIIPYKKGPNNIIGSAGDAKTDDPAATFYGKRILAVDDNLLNLLLLKKLVQRWNIVFFEASSGKEALDIFSKNEIDIVFTDLNMPKMNGEALISAIKKLKGPKGKVPIIVMSGATDLTEEKISAMGINGTIKKPFQELELLEQLKEVFKDS